MGEILVERNQIRILCADCGCYYYFWDIEFNFKNYDEAVKVSSEDMNKCCPECGSQKMAAHVHHSSDYFNCETQYLPKTPRYLSGPGSGGEPIKAKEVGSTKIVFEGTVVGSGKDKIWINSDQDRFMVIECDGLFDFCQGQKAVISIQLDGE